MPHINLYNQWKAIPYFFTCGHAIRDINIEIFSIYIERFDGDLCDTNYLDFDVAILGFKITTRWFLINSNS